MTSFNKVRIIDPDAERYKIERRQHNRRVVFICLTILTSVFTLIDIVSDVVLRNTAFHFVGTSADAWDWSCTILGLVWIWMAVKIWRDND